MLTITDLRVRYGPLEVLHELTMSIPKGEIVALVGANAAGKTTTLNAVSGVLHAAGGSIVFDGEVINGVPTHRRVEMGIVQVPQGRQLFPYMSVQENLDLGAYTPAAYRLRNESGRRVFELFPVLHEKRGQSAGTLSGGEQQMLAVGRALMAQPKLLMLDEPSEGLAPLLVKAILEAVRHINSLGVTVLLVEQNVGMALNIADRGSVIENGRIVLNGSGTELLCSTDLKRAFLGM